MKKTTLTIIAFSILSAAGYAQGFYFRAGLGYAFPLAGQTMDGTGTPISGTQTSLGSGSYSYSLKGGASFSAGTQGVIGFGYMFNKHIGVQLDAGIGVSTKKYTGNIDNVYVDSVLSNISIIQKAKTPIIVMPSVVLHSGGKVADLYVRMGLALPLRTEMKMDWVKSNVPGTGLPTVDDFTYKVKSSFSLGFTGATGLQYKLNDKTSLWVEASMLTMSLYIKEAELSAASRNGKNVPLGYVIGNHVVQYSKSGTVDPTGAVQPTYSQPFSNVGINVGVSFALADRGRNHSSKFNSQEGDKPQPFRRR